MFHFLFGLVALVLGRRPSLRGHGRCRYLDPLDPTAPERYATYLLVAAYDAGVPVWGVVYEDGSMRVCYLSGYNRLAPPGDVLEGVHRDVPPRVPPRPRLKVEEVDAE